MYCTHCGVKLDYDSLFCSSCGTKVENFRNTSNQVPVKPSKVYSGEELYLRAYVGNAYDSIIGKKFNIFILLFGSYYVGYKKMYLLSIAWASIIAMVSYYNEFLSFVVGCILSILGSFIFNSLYEKHVKKEINAIKEDKKYDDENQLLYMLKNKGGNSGLGIFLPLLVIFLCLLVMYYVGG